jgi:hypothetical protein
MSVALDTAELLMSVALDTAELLMSVDAVEMVDSESASERYTSLKRSIPCCAVRIDVVLLEKWNLQSGMSISTEYPTAWYLQGVRLALL